MGLGAGLFGIYHENILPYVKNIRGAFWINRRLSKLLEKELDQVPEEETTNIFDKEWDNLIILDACRYDYYKELEPESDYIYSVASHSREFIEKTFSEGDFSDIVYITGNPHFSDKEFRKYAGRELNEVFYSVYKTFETDWRGDDGIRPEPIIRDAKTAEKLFPDKKKIIHFMQPHAPYIASDIEKRVKYRPKYPQNQKKAYVENLKFVKDQIESLIQDLDGKTVITADHGEIMGEKGIYHTHLSGVNANSLRKVPWHRIK